MGLWLGQCPGLPDLPLSSVGMIQGAGAEPISKPWALTRFDGYQQSANGNILVSTQFTHEAQECVF